MDLITILGLIAAVSTTISFLPQVIRTVKTKSTGDLSLAMYLFFSFGVLMWLIYGIMIRDLPVIIANAATILLSLIILFYKIKYK